MQIFSATLSSISLHFTVVQSTMSFHTVLAPEMLKQSLQNINSMFIAVQFLVIHQCLVWNSNMNAFLRTTVKRNDFKISLPFMLFNRDSSFSLTSSQYYIDSISFLCCYFQQCSKLKSPLVICPILVNRCIVFESRFCGQTIPISILSNDVR